MNVPLRRRCACSVEAAYRQGAVALDPVARRVPGTRIGGMQGERMPGHRRPVRRAVVRQQAMEAHQGAGFRFQRHRGAVVRPRRAVQLFHRDAVAVAQETLAQRAAVAAGFRPQAAVVDRRVFQREPEGGDADRRAVEEGGVLVPAHFAADARLFEYVDRMLENTNNE